MTVTHAAGLGNKRLLQKQQKAVDIFLLFSAGWLKWSSSSLAPSFVPSFAYSYLLCSHLPHTPCTHACRSHRTCFSFPPPPPCLRSASPTNAVHPVPRVSRGLRGEASLSRHDPRVFLRRTALLFSPPVCGGFLGRSAEFSLVHRVLQRQLLPQISRTRGRPWPWPGSLLCTLPGWGVSWISCVSDEAEV